MRNLVGYKQCKWILILNPEIMCTYRPLKSMITSLMNFLSEK
jgi:hypothetical protein